MVLKREIPAFDFLPMPRTLSQQLRKNVISTVQLQYCQSQYVYASDTPKGNTCILHELFRLAILFHIQNHAPQKDELRKNNRMLGRKEQGY